MAGWVDLSLVALLVCAAAAYLIARQIRSNRRRERDWSTGHADAACDSCPVVKIRNMRRY